MSKICSSWIDTPERAGILFTQSARNIELKRNHALCYRFYLRIMTTFDYTPPRMRTAVERARGLSHKALATELLSRASRTPEFWRRRASQQPAHRLLRDHLQRIREHLQRMGAGESMSTQERDNAQDWLDEVMVELNDAQARFGVMNHSGEDARYFWQVLLLEALRRIDAAVQAPAQKADTAGATPSPFRNGNG